MSAARAGVVIIGSNSTRMLTADINESLSDPARSRVETRLFLGLSDDKMLSGEAIAAAADSAALLYRQALDAGAGRVFLLATSAARDARNAAELAAQVRARCGAELWVLSGRMEALYGYLGAASGFPGAGPVGVIDIGGGSTEIAWGAGDAIAFSRSFQMGAGRLHAQCPIHTAADIAAARAAAARAFAEPGWPGAPPGRWLLVGGTGSALKDIALGLPAASPSPEYFDFDRALAQSQLELMASLTPAQRASVPGLPAGREHIYPAGLAVLLAAMDALGAGRATVTLRNNTHGFLYACARAARA